MNQITWPWHEAATAAGARDGDSVQIERESTEPALASRVFPPFRWCWRYGGALALSHRRARVHP